MPTRMLIDAAHPEETRVVVVRDGKVEEFDFEAAARKQLRGNIYLAKVTRVEPSLQAAFVDYGGNRHGFLAFSEIHPDYYQIPYADRQALIAEEAEEETSDDEDSESRAADDDAPAGEAQDDDEGENDNADTREAAASGDDKIESVGGADAMEEVPERRSRARSRRSYKIQEVIKKRQILLVQVVKEERGNKGAALTTYLSLAGRYSVLMPNTARGGGISRKITSASDRKRLKEIVSDLDVPEGMGVILRTAGAARTKAEVKRDFEYLLRLWENVRELTLNSVAPALVYEEGSLVKRAIRDLYTKDIDHVLVNGDASYREAKDFMRMLMPSHAKNIQPYREKEPIFFKHNVEGQLDAMFSPQVTLKSGGYIVLNQTEALVSIDVNSGRSTREHNIEDTALKTNLEAADEIARQLRLRDLAGLIVIDFIDMDEKRNNRAVERRVKEVLKHDRARIQVGRISHFGLLEMSRQRIRAGLLESSLEPCAHCEGTGKVRSVESVALHVLRSIEYELLRGKPTDLVVRVQAPVALYILNQKRETLRELEALGISIMFEADTSLSGADFKLERGEPARRPADEGVVRPASIDPDATYEEAETESAEEAEETEDARAADQEDEDGERGARRGRRRRRRGRGRGGEAQSQDGQAAVETAQDSDEESQEHRAEQDGDESQPRRRRRGRRGGRRHRRDGDGQSAEQQATDDVAADDSAAQPEARPEELVVIEASDQEGEPVPEPASAEAETAAANTDAEAAAEAPEPAAAETPAADAEQEPPAETKPKKRAPRRSRAKKAVEETPPTIDTETAAPADAQPETSADGGGETKPVEREPEPAEASEDADAEAKSPRRGWWQRKSGLFGF